MNPYTGHLVMGGVKLQADYELIPERLEALAKAELAGRDETHVDLRKSGALQDWAKKKRKAKAAAKSRRINRGR